jgi:hypothetical protein
MKFERRAQQAERVRRIPLAVCSYLFDKQLTSTLS